VLPLAVIGLSVYVSLLTPVTDTITRTMEFEGDMHGLKMLLVNRTARST
jgi:mannose/fructose/N-acetylgalactosamine-specific phosphotransferase system component IID